jgi:hypothetical protein
VASGTSTVSHHVLGPVGVSKAYRARHLSPPLLPRPCPSHPPFLTPSSAPPVRPRPRRRPLNRSSPPINANPLIKLRSKSRSPEPSRAQAGRQLPCLDSPLPAFSLVSVSSTLSFPTPSYFSRLCLLSFTFVHIIPISILPPILVADAFTSYALHSHSFA